MFMQIASTETPCDIYRVTFPLIRKNTDSKGGSALDSLINFFIEADSSISLDIYLTLSSLTLHRHLHPLQAANCCRNSRLVVDEDDLMWFKKQ